MDFFQISTKKTRDGVTEVRPDFTVGRSKDLMIRGGMFYAVWDEEKGLWSTDEYDVQRLVDQEIDKYVEKLKADGITCCAKYLRSFGTNGWAQFRKYMRNVSDNSKQLDMKLTFANTEVKKSDCVSRRLPYDLAPGDHKAWDELVSVLYAPEERAKIEWAIGAIVSGDSKKIQKFLVFYGPPGSGKGTILEITQKMLEGYYTTFDAKALVGNNNSFSTEVFKSNPLVAIQHDGDLSRIDDNSKLNSIVSHEEMTMNEKYKPSYTSRINAFLFMGSNKPVKITDAKSGIIRRLIDVSPTGEKFEPDYYFALMQRIEFELGAIAQHCLDVYRSMGKNYYNAYRPLNMMLQTDVFFNFIEASYDVFKEQDGTTLTQAYALWKEYVIEAGLEHKLPRHKFREELKNYFEVFEDRAVINGLQTRNVYSGFTARPFKTPVEPPTKPPSYSLIMDETESIFDEMYAGQTAQYAKEDDTPEKRWVEVKTILEGLDTKKIHFVKVPENHIVIDFDLKGDDGEKSLEKNLVAASSWPPTYAEISKSGKGVHLHYIYDGDTSELAREYSEGVEIKVYRGNASLRRKLTKCNNIPVATITSGLPFREKKPMLETKTLQSEKGLRELIARNLNREIHPGTKPSVDFIAKILDDAYKSGMSYDVTDLRSRILAFANNSRNQALTCLKTVQKMKWKSELTSEDVTLYKPVEDNSLVFYDVEVYPNLFVICWKYEDSQTVIRMINPVPRDVESLFDFKLVGFNNRRYDNHILWARYMGYNNEELYRLSQRIINNENGALFGEAYNLSYADIYDFSSKKQGLKKFQIDLGITHKEMDIPWDEPVPDDRIMDVVEYCCNDVVATQAAFVDRKQDFVARQILADLSGLPVNSTTRKHAEKILFGDDRQPQNEFVYTDLSKMFEGYEFDEFAKIDKSTYRGEPVGEGGYVYAEPGMYENVVVLDVASMHPTSIEELNLFGPYTEKFSALKRARVALKHGDYAKARELLPWEVSGTEDAKALSDALKLVINSIYGYTSATFPNPFRDPRNKDNIVAKRGALFMINLKHEVQKRGFKVAHIKTDSIKIPNATQEIIEFVMEYGKLYGYDFEHECTYEKFCLVNDAVYIAKLMDDGSHDAGDVFGEGWTATGAQFKHPYVFKTLFSGQPLSFDDLCETKHVTQGVMYLDFTHHAEKIEHMHHVGRTGRFVPVVEGVGGGILYRVKDGKLYAVTGTKDHLWLEADVVKALNDNALERMPFENFYDAVEGTGSIADVIDLSYFNDLVADAIETIEKFGSFKEFVK